MSHPRKISLAGVPKPSPTIIRPTRLAQELRLRTHPGWNLHGRCRCDSTAAVPAAFPDAFSPGSFRHPARHPRTPLPAPAPAAPRGEPVAEPGCSCTHCTESRRGNSPPGDLTTGAPPGSHRGGPRRRALTAGSSPGISPGISQFRGRDAKRSIHRGACCPEWQRNTEPAAADRSPGAGGQRASAAPPAPRAPAIPDAPVGTGSSRESRVLSAPSTR